MCSAGMLPASVVVRKCRWNARPRAGETPALRDDFRDSDVLQGWARVLQKTLKRLPAMQLDGSQASLRNEVADVISIGIDEYADFFDVLGQVLDNIAHRSRFHLARTLVVKDEAEGVGPCVNCRERVFEIRDSADFDPSHKGRRQSSVVGKGKPLAAVATNPYRQHRFIRSGPRLLPAGGAERCLERPPS